MGPTRFRNQLNSSKNFISAPTHYVMIQKFLYIPKNNVSIIKLYFLGVINLSYFHLYIHISLLSIVRWVLGVAAHRHSSNTLFAC